MSNPCLRFSEDLFESSIARTSCKYVEFGSDPIDKKGKPFQEVPINVLLYKAVADNNLDEVLSLLKKGANFHEPVNIDKVMTLPLFEAARQNNIKMAKVLLKLGHNINVFDSYRMSPLIYAILRQHEEMVTLLLDHGAIIENEETRGRTLLAAIKGGNETIFQSLLQKQDLANCWIELLMDPYETCTCCKKIETYYTVFKKKKILSLTPIVSAIMYNRPSLVKTLIQFGANVNMPASELGHPLCQAVIANSIELVTLLLEAGSLTTGFVTLHHKRYRPAELAAQNFQNEILDLLLERY